MSFPEKELSHAAQRLPKREEALELAVFNVERLTEAVSKKRHLVGEIT